MVQRRNESAAPDGLREPGMQTNTFDWQRGEIPESEVRYTTSRGGGPGGQGVNTTDSRVELRWHIERSTTLSPKQKTTVREFAGEKARKRLVEGADELKFVCISERSQVQNKRDCLNRLNAFLRDALTPVEERITTKKPRRVKARERAVGEADKRRKAGRGKIQDWE